MSYYKEQLKDFLKDRDFRSDRVLSVGKMNDDLKYFRSADYTTVTTIDVDPQYAPDILMDMNLGMEQISAETFVRVVRDGFDDLFTFELWEYIYSPMTALQNCYALLKNGGRLWVSAPFIYPTHNPVDADYLRYTEHFWMRILPKFGFKIEEYRRRVWKDAEPYLESVALDGMRPAKEYAHHDITGHLIIAQKVVDEKLRRQSDRAWNDPRPI